MTRGSSRSKGIGGSWQSWRRSAFRLVIGFLAFTLVPVAALRWMAPPTSAFMVRERCLALIDGVDDFRIQYRWIPLDRISPHAALAVIAAEDQLFSGHFGFDFDAIVKAWDGNQRGKRLRGGSTISQQTAKNLFLFPGRSYLRKGLEAYFTLLIEALWPKRRILEVYLNTAQFGAGIYGVEAASQAFFRKPAQRLKPSEAALLAAVLPNPLRYRVTAPSAYVLQRRAWILKHMGYLGGTHYLHAITSD